jgi:3-deoxy-D-manno-octulosonic-acid transferase
MSAFLLDIAYALILVLASPWLLFKAVRTGKYRTGLVQKFLGAVPTRDSGRPCIWFHAVSVGEVMLLRRVVAELTQRRPDVQIVISTTTNTGMDVARQHFAAHMLVYFPLDFSWAVSRAISSIRPDVVVLTELELWPNFIAAAKRFGARVAVINGRMSPRSYRGYHRVQFLMRSILAKIDAFAIQTDEFAQRFVRVGAPPDEVFVTGSVKYDGVETDRNNPATLKLRELFDLQPGEIVWVAGSTSDPEEQIVLDVYERLLARHPSLRLILVPRHKERFDEVAKLIVDRGHALLRRSQLQVAASRLSTTNPVPVSDSTEQQRSIEEKSRITNQKSKILLVDTLGELTSVWGLADIAFVGGTFAPRGGQNMIEPAGYGAAVVVGPGVWNFQDTVNHLLACRGAVQVATPYELGRVLDTLASNSGQRRNLGNAARTFVLSQHGATNRTIGVLDRLLPPATQIGRNAA